MPIQNQHLEHDLKQPNSMWSNDSEEMQKWFVGPQGVETGELASKLAEWLEKNGQTAQSAAG